MNERRTISWRGLFASLIGVALLAGTEAQAVEDHALRPPEGIELPVLPAGATGWARPGSTSPGPGLVGTPSNHHAGPPWGPGNPTLYTRYFSTPHDYDNELNPHYIQSDGLVPRNSYAVEMQVFINVHNLSCPYVTEPACAHKWNFYFFDRQDGVIWWWQIFTFFHAGTKYIAVSDPNGTEWYDQYAFPSEWLLGIAVNCERPDGTYAAAVQLYYGSDQLYFIPFFFDVGGGANNGCSVPPVPTPQGPAGCVNTQTPTLSWGLSTGASSYDVLVKDVQTQQPVVNPRVSTTSYSVPAGLLANNRPYSWAVRANNQTGSSAYSSALVFTPKCTVPPPPQPLAPSGCIDTTTPTLHWSQSTGATNYHVRVVDGQDGHVVTSQTVTATSWAVPPGLLQENRRYNWTVKAANAYGTSADSNLLSFVPHCDVPPPPQAQAPSGCINTLTPTLMWTGSGVADDYEFYVSDSETDVQVLRQVVSSTSFAVPPGTFEADRAYHWRVRARNSYGNSAWSNLLRFVPECGPPREAPAVHVPTECIGTLEPTFSWSAVPRAAKYQLYVAETATGSVVVNAFQSETTYTAPPGRLQPDTEYHWHVKGVSPSNQSGPPSETRFFTPLCKEITDDEDIRPENDPSGACSPEESVGKPVSVLTGNMYLDQTDVVVGGVGSLAFGRSYNSANVEPGRHGVFGPGWSHPYETSVWVRYTLLVLRQPNGAVLYFDDDDRDGRYDPRSPADRSWVLRHPDGSYERRFRSGGAQFFDGAGRLGRIVDTVGNATTLVRDGAGKLRTIQDIGGRALTLTWEGERLTRVQAPAGVVTVTYGYDSLNRLETVTYGDGSGFRFAYDGESRLLAVFDHTDRVVETHTYDGDGRALTSSLAEGRESYTFGYEPLRTTVTDALGAVTTYDYEEIGGSKHVVRITGPCAGCGGGTELQEWTYDSAGRVASHSRGSQVVSTYEYDPVTGDLVIERDGLSNATIFTYYADGRLRTVTRADGSHTATTYVAAGPSRVTELVEPGRTRTSSIRYTPRGQVEQVTDPRGKVTRFVYDDPGDLREIHGPENQVWSFTYDEAGRRRTATGPLQETVTTTYDAAGRPKRVTNPDETFVEYTYDHGGRLSHVSDSLGRVVRHGYDPFGRLEFSVDALGSVTRRSYDLMSRLAGITDARGQTTAFEYDSLGRLSRTVHPDGGVDALTYDEHGRVAARTDRRGVVTTYRYDAAGRLLSKTYSDGTPPVSYGYDAAGRMTSASIPYETLEWTYDLLGRPVTERSSFSASTVAYSYDDASNRTELRLDGELLAGYQYDDASRLRQFRPWETEFRLEYEATRRASLWFPNGVATSYAYSPDGMSRLTHVLAARQGSAAVARAAYTHDLAGNRTSKETTEGREEYRYDPLDRLVEVSAPAGAARFAYDTVGNRIREEAGGAVVTTSFDVSNRLLTRAPGGTVPVAGTVDETAHVTVNGRPARALSGRRFESETAARQGANTFDVRAVDLAGNATTQTYSLDVAASGESGFLYDANGNLTRRPDGEHEFHYEWDAENRLTSVLRNGVEVARISYDPLGRRIQKMGGGVVTRYVHDGLDILRETRIGPSGTTTFQYAHGPGIDEPLARRDSAGTLTFYHADGLGSIVATSDETGAVTSRRHYDVWGHLLAGSSEAGYAFTGREWDPETDVYYYRARYYDPQSGRFLSEDPIGHLGGLNFYLYVRNRPATSIDPFGLYDLDDLFFDAAQASAGFGDTLTLGASAYIRSAIASGAGLTDTPDVVCQTSGAYRAGKYAAYAHGVATGAAGALNAGARSVFYSGRGALEAATAGKGSGVLLSETLGGRVLTAVRAPDPLLRVASAIYAANAKGTAQVFLRGPVRPEAILLTVEQPILRLLGNATLLFK